MSELRFEIPRVPFGPNGPKGLLRMHWAKRRRYNDEWEWEILARVMKLRPESGPLFERASVHIHQIRTKLMDPDNLVASTKPLLDGIVRCRILRDDSPKNIDLTVTQEIGKEKRTIFILKGLPEGPAAP